MQLSRNHIETADALDYARSLPDESVNCIVTSPPYFGLRDYGVKGQMGLEPTLADWLAGQVELFRELRRVLRSDGTCWLNLGDSYDGKSLLGQPWRLAFALEDDGWYLRRDIIWHKCLSGGVKLYAKTQKGAFPQRLKDLVRLDPATVQLWTGDRWTQVLSWQETPRPNDPIEIELRSGETIGCTPNHVWPTQRGNVRADMLKVGDVIAGACLPEPDAPLTPAFVPDCVGYLVGLFLAEGSYGKEGRLIQLAGNTDETAKRLTRLAPLVADYGGTIRAHDTGENGATLNIHSKIIAEIIKDYITGRSAKTKRLTAKCWARSNVFLRHVLDGYLEGDGHYDAANDRWRLSFTRNYDLADSLRTLAARLGVSVRLRKTTARIGDAEYKTFHGQLRFAVSDHHNTKQESEVVRIGASRARKFWDVSVADAPHLFALASGVLTHNSNPMPESAKDRPTTAHEYVFLLTKAPRYWYDADAVRVRGTKTVVWGSDNYANNNMKTSSRGQYTGEKVRRKGEHTANLKSVWTIPTQPFAAAHFATFPEKLAATCIKAGAPKKTCADCGAPWVRGKEFVGVKRVNSNGYEGQKWQREQGQQKRSDTGVFGSGNIKQYKDHGLQPACDCNADALPGIVYDPFMGAGTTALVAQKLGRDYIGSELNPEYADLARARVAGRLQEYQDRKAGKPTTAYMFPELGRPAAQLKDKRMRNSDIYVNQTGPQKND